MGDEEVKLKIQDSINHCQALAQFYPTFYKSRATRQETAIFRVPNQKEHRGIAKSGTFTVRALHFP